MPTKGPSLPHTHTHTHITLLLLLFSFKNNTKVSKGQALGHYHNTYYYNSEGQPK